MTIVTLLTVVMILNFGHNQIVIPMFEDSIREAVRVVDSHAGNVSAPNKP